MKTGIDPNLDSRWKRSQDLLSQWRSQNPITDQMAMLQYDQVAAWIGNYLDRGRLLDVGCKTGGLRKSDRYPPHLEYHGIDPLIIPEGEYDFAYQCITVEQMDYESCSFDAVLIKDSIDYFVDPLYALNRLCEVLTKPGGLLFISEGDHFSSASLVLMTLSSGSRSIFGRLRRICLSQRRVEPCNHMTNAAMIDYHETYPNGDLSVREIQLYLRKAGYLTVQSRINEGRLWIVAQVK